MIKENGEWRNIFRLSPQQVTTIGRAATNRVILQDEICSRHHCEILNTGDAWILRDLESRNGTYVGRRQVQGEWHLHDGEIIKLGRTKLCFREQFNVPETADEIAVFPGEASENQQEVDPTREHRPEIIKTQEKSQMLGQASADGSGQTTFDPRVHRLFRLALNMGAAENIQKLSNLVLQALSADTGAAIGAILLLPKESGHPEPDQLNLVAYVAPDSMPYSKPSRYLSEQVFKTSRAVLAHDVSGNSSLAARDSLGQLHAKSVICAPIRHQQRLIGLIHLYSNDPDLSLDEDALEYTLALSEYLGGTLASMLKQETLQTGLARVQDENKSLRRQLEIETELVGQSSVMRDLQHQIQRVAPTDASTLIRGESGVGKELVARAIHFNSPRKSKPFVCLNCAALSETLLESELFGHEKGAFTGATARKQGKFEQAHQGTLFLDEVGEMSQAIQAKFLRVLEGHVFERVGGATQIKADVRVVAATNRDLEDAVHEGLFRRDLYFRLHVVQIHVAPLRERKDDIPELARSFVARLAEKSGRPEKDFSPEAMRMLREHDWPGNVRELKNAIERAYILTEGDLITPGAIRFSSLETEFADSQFSDDQAEPRAHRNGFEEISLSDLERQHILAILDRYDWNKTQAAQILGIERSTLDRKLKRYGVTRPS